MIENESYAREVVLAAAGASTRMGDWKPLLPFRGATIIDATLAGIRKAGLEAIVVAGFRGEELRRMLRGREGVRLAWNHSWEHGLSSSIAAGLRAARGDSVYIMHADLPLAGSEPYAVLAREWAQRRDEGLREVPLSAAFEGRMGHPILVSRSLALRLAEANGGSRLREAFLAAGMTAVETGESGVLADVDTPRDYDRLIAGA